MRVAADSQQVSEAPAFSGEVGSLLCPVNAISWDVESERPRIDESVCIGCGLCVLRCPTGFLYIQDGKASIPNQDLQAQLVDQVSIGPASRKAQQTSLASLPIIQNDTPLRKDQELIHVHEALAQLTEAQQNALVRSALIVLGGKSTLSRQGDVHTRADGVYSFPGSVFGPLEIEFGSDSLDAVRAALDDVAVFFNRYAATVSNQEPLVVARALPRERQGYWQVVTDISKVLDLEVHTITVGALLLLAWNYKVIEGDDILSFSPKFDATSVREVIERLLGRTAELPLGFQGILEPEK